MWNRDCVMPFKWFLYLPKGSRYYVFTANSGIVLTVESARNRKSAGSGIPLPPLPYFRIAQYWITPAIFFLRKQTLSSLTSSGVCWQVLELGLRQWLGVELGVVLPRKRCLTCPVAETTDKRCGNIRDENVLQDT